MGLEKRAAEPVAPIGPGWPEPALFAFGNLWMHTSTNDLRVEIAKAQNEIQTLLGLASDHLIFEYTPKGNQTRLSLITINPRHQQSFLFHQTYGVDQADAAKKMLEYVRSSRQNESTYTIQWRSKDDSQIHVSYFNAKTIYEALDKLYYGRDMNSITVYLIKLNPIS